MTPRWGRVGAMAVAVLVAACGSGSSDSGGQRVELVELEQAFAAAAGADTYRLTQSTGQDLSSAALGLNTQTSIDLDQPTVVAEITPDAAHVTVNLGPIVGPLLGDRASSLAVEIWQQPDRLVVDSRSYAEVLEVNPDAELGPFRPGVSFVDLTSAEVDSPELLAALLGQGSPDLRDLATRLPAALQDVRRKGSTLTGSASYADLLKAIGSDVRQVARSTVAGLTLELDIDDEALNDFYVSFYEDTSADVTLELDANGLVRSMRYGIDLSGVYDQMFSQANPLGLDASEQELEDATRSFEDMTWTIDSLTTFEVVDDLVIPTPPLTTDDRTDEWVAFLQDAGS